MTRRLTVLVLAGLLLAACGGDDGAGTVHLYDHAPVPAVPDRTHPIDPALTSGGADGQYWAELTGWSDGDQPVLTFRLTQALFADACIEQLGADQCPDDYGTIDDPSRTVDVAIGDLATVTVVAENQQNYAITAEELLALAGDAAPAAAAPADFRFGGFPFLLTMRGGVVVEAHQIWVP
jgi:hypothetical protein